MGKKKKKKEKKRPNAYAYLSHEPPRLVQKSSSVKKRAWRVELEARSYEYLYSSTKTTRKSTVFHCAETRRYEYYSNKKQRKIAVFY